MQLLIVLPKLQRIICEVLTLNVAVCGKKPKDISFYEETGAVQFVIDDVKNSACSKAFHPEFVLSGKEDAANNSAHGLGALLHTAITEDDEQMINSGVMLEKVELENAVIAAELFEEQIDAASKSFVIEESEVNNAKDLKIQKGISLREINIINNNSNNNHSSIKQFTIQESNVSNISNLMCFEYNFYEWTSILNTASMVYSICLLDLGGFISFCAHFLCVISGQYLTAKLAIFCTQILFIMSGYIWQIFPCNNILKFIGAILIIFAMKNVVNCKQVFYTKDNNRCSMNDILNNNERESLQPCIVMELFRHSLIQCIKFHEQNQLQISLKTIGIITMSIQILSVIGGTIYCDIKSCENGGYPQIKTFNMQNIWITGSIQMFSR
jgi:hypothetical protein